MPVLPQLDLGLSLGLDLDLDLGLGLDLGLSLGLALGLDLGLDPQFGSFHSLVLFPYSCVHAAVPCIEFPSI